MVLRVRGSKVIFVPWILSVALRRAGVFKLATMNYESRKKLFNYCQNNMFEVVKKKSICDVYKVSKIVITNILQVWWHRRHLCKSLQIVVNDCKYSILEDMMGKQIWRNKLCDGIKCTTEKCNGNKRNGKNATEKMQRKKMQWKKCNEKKCYGKKGNG